MTVNLTADIIHILDSNGQAAGSGGFALTGDGLTTTYAYVTEAVEADRSRPYA